VDGVKAWRAHRITCAPVVPRIKTTSRLHFFFGERTTIAVYYSDGAMNFVVTDAGASDLPL
jgi:hypothetical protein